MQRLHASERELVSLFSAHSFCSHTKAGTAGRLFVCISASSEPREFWSVFAKRMERDVLREIRVSAARRILEREVGGERLEGDDLV